MRTVSSERRVGFTITRMLDATPQQVWRMWTEASELTHWLHPDSVVTPVDTIDFDVRAGGRLRYTMLDETTGRSYAITGVFREVDPHRRLVFTWSTPDHPDDDSATIISVDLADRGGRTELTLDVRGLPSVAGDDDVHVGWDHALSLLAKHAAS